MVPNFPNLVKYINLQVFKVQKTPNSINMKKIMPRYITIRLLKAKNTEKILQVA